MESIRADLLSAQTEDVSWTGGRLQGLNHFGGYDVLDVGLQAYGLYASTNPVSRRAFPSVIRLQDDIIHTVLSLLCGPEGATGTVTSGGTESVFLAMKSARDCPEMSRHPGTGNRNAHHGASNKHADYLVIKPVRVPE